MGNFLGKLFGFGTTNNEQLTVTNSKVEEPLPTKLPPQVETQDTDVDEKEDNGKTANIEKCDEVKKKDNRTLITKEIVGTVLRNDYGSEAKLLNYEVVDFTKPGDNYATLVTSIQCEADINGKNIKTTYVAKLNNQWQMAGMDEMTQEFFLREGKFLTEVKSKLNEVLDEINEPNLTLPACLYEEYEMGKELLIMKDLRERGFKMFNRHVGMDVEHATMVLNELARDHAAGFILKEKNKGKTLLSTFPYLIDAWLTNPTSEAGIIQYFQGIAQNAAAMLDDQNNYKLVQDWLVRQKERLIDTFKEQLFSNKETFTTICHGDIWNNNVLFRYNQEKHPEEVILLDLQMSRVASLGTDLLYFLYSSMEGDYRNEHLDTLLHSYYSTLECILKKAQIKVPFTFVELKQEIEDKYIFGLISTLILIPIILMKEEDVTDFSTISDDNMEEVLRDDGEKSKKMMKDNPSYKSRFLTVFDDGLRIGAFN